MIRRVGLAACALVLLAATAVAAQPVVLQDGRYVVMTPVPTAGLYEISGVVRYTDPVRGILRLDDGRNIAVDENTQVLVNGAPQMLGTLAPGTFVVVRSSKPFAFRDTTYYVTTAPPAVVAPAPVAVAAAPPGAVTGTVVRVDQPNVIVLSDGRVIPATAQTVVMVDNRAVPVTALQPGTHVLIYPSGQTAIVTQPSALPLAATYPEMGLREQAAEHNAP